MNDLSSLIELKHVFLCLAVEKINCFLLMDYQYLLTSLEEYNVERRTSPPEQATEINLWERLGKADVLNIESSSFSWNTLSSLHHTEHGSSTEQSEDELNKALEVCRRTLISGFLLIPSSGC